MRASSVTLERADRPRRRASVWVSTARTGRRGVGVIASLALHVALFGALWSVGRSVAPPQPRERLIDWTPTVAPDLPAETEEIEPTDVAAREPDLTTPPPIVATEEAPPDDASDLVFPDLADAVAADGAIDHVAFGPSNANLRVAPGSAPVVGVGAGVAAATSSPPAPQAVSAPRRAVVTRPVPRPENLPPAFPTEAAERGERGDVAIRLWISVEGTVVDVVVERTSGSPSLDRAAVEAASRWRFSPATRDGAPVPAVLRQVVHFA